MSRWPRDDQGDDLPNRKLSRIGKLTMNRIRLPNHYVIDIDAAVDSIRRFNSSTTMAASEHLLDQHFATIEQSLEPTTVAERVALLDGLWATQLFRESGAADCIVTNLALHAPRLKELFHRLPPKSLDLDPDTVIEAAAKALPVILNHTPKSKERFRQNYSFATKFFHWVTRRHFPIVDNRARRRISAIQRDHNVSGRVRSATAAMNGLTYADEYPRWIYFYSDLISGLRERDRERLLREDFNSQIPAYRIKNTLLRILDKVFYLQGGGSGLGRFDSLDRG